uniref:trans-sulfuration enzyme family protein n=1 Tax=Persicitalea sp. TaxID=3100273 RepID=UPI003593719B
MDISHIINELGEDRQHYYNAITPPIFQTSNFAVETFAELRSAFADERSAFIYTRTGNPTVDILRKKLAALDGAEDALVFNSGASAIYGAIMANVSEGDHIVSVEKPYNSAWRLFNDVLPRFGVKTTYIDGTKIENFEAALCPETRVIFLESPNSLTYELQDLAAVAQLARSRNILTVIDNSYCTPLYQKPHSFGIDLSLQSATKYIGGHSDTVAGVLTGSKALLDKVFLDQIIVAGTQATPFDAWLLLRGLRTLPMRLERITRTTQEIIGFLKSHPKIERVIFPLDEDFPQIELARKQMSGAFGLLTIVLKTDSHAQIEKFTLALKHFLMAVSWGGHESLVLPQAAGMKPEDFDATIERHRMVRIYVGLEDAAYLTADLN